MSLSEYLLNELYAPSGKAQAPEVPKTIYVPTLPADKKEMEMWLRSLRGSSVTVSTAQRGEKAALAKTAFRNAEHALNNYKLKRSSDFIARADALAGIQAALEMENAPLRIECFDISHLSGTNTVGSMVVFEDAAITEAVEWILSEACGRRFYVSTDNLNGDPAAVETGLARFRQCGG